MLIIGSDHAGVELKENKELNKKYQELLRIRDKIYKNDEKEIEAIIIEERKQKND